MKINVNNIKQGQCPGCHGWWDLLPDHTGSGEFEFTCRNCNRNFVVHINSEKLEELINEGG